MLSALTIENLALVDRIELSLRRGLNVLTGETGAGKSVLVNAFSLVLGSRASTDVIRTGAQEAVVEAMLEVPERGELLDRLRARGLEVEAGEILVRRIISRSGKGRVTINGQMVTLSMLADLMRGIVDITGQHEHVSLLDPTGHLDIVDAYGGLLDLRRRVAAAHEEVMGYRAALDSISLDEAEKERREDYLRFALDEINSVDPKAGEVEALEAERKRLRGAEDLLQGVRRAEGSLYSDDGAVVEAVGRVQNELLRLARVDERLASLSTSAATVLAELEELSRELARYSSQLAANPDRLTEVEERLEALKKVVRKHGGSVESALATRDAMAAELDGIEHEDARRADLGAALAEAEEKRKVLALELSAARHRVVRSLEIAVQSELGQLCMLKTTFKVELVPEAEIGSRGAESAEIVISANTGEPPRPLRKIASGGELSRVLLAIKHVLADESAVGAYVFDEIDTGIGGRVADVIGRKLKEVARAHQVVCITHLPQVACHADVHFRVEKGEEKGRTTTTVRELDDEERTEEIARMLGGLEITEVTRTLAREMLGRAPKKDDVAPARERARALPPAQAAQRGRRAKADRP